MEYFERHQGGERAILVSVSVQLLEDIDTDPFNFRTRQSPTQKSKKDERNTDMVAGGVGRPTSEPIR